MANTDANRIGFELQATVLLLSNGYHPNGQPVRDGSGRFTSAVDGLKRHLTQTRLTRDIPDPNGMAFLSLPSYEEPVELDPADWF
jgi:hypothetical protein